MGLWRDFISFGMRWIAGILGFGAKCCERWPGGGAGFPVVGWAGLIAGARRRVRSRRARPSRVATGVFDVVNTICAEAVQKPSRSGQLLVSAEAEPFCL